MMILKRMLLTAAVLTAAVMPNTGFAQSLKEISYALPSKSFPVASPRLAQEMGLWEKHGIHPNFTYVDSMAATATTLISRSVDFAATETTSVIAAAARDQALVIVARHYTGLSASIVLSKATVERLGVSPSAPAADRLKALDKVLLSGTSKISSTTVSFKSAANAAGAEPRFSYMAVAAAPSALEAGAVEGSIVTSPFWALMVRRGAAVLWLSPAQGDIDPKFQTSAPVTTVTRKDFAEANPELVRNVAAVFDDLATAIQQQPDAAKAAYARLYPDLDAETLDMILKLESKALSGPPLTPDDIHRDIQYMKASGGDFGPIEKVVPEDVLLKR